MIWLRDHLVGATIFAPAVLLLAGAAYYAWGTHRKRLLPWLFLGIWLLAVTAHYQRNDIGRLYSYYRLMWGAQLMTLGIVTAVPLALTVLPYAAPAQTTGHRRYLALTGLLLGLLAILMVLPLSRLLGDLLSPMIHAATP